MPDRPVGVNFAPVVDLDANPDSPAIGRHGRSFSADPVLGRRAGTGDPVAWDHRRSAPRSVGYTAVVLSDDTDDPALGLPWKAADPEAVPLPGW